MADRFEGFDPDRDREYLRRMLGDEDFKLLFRDLDRSLPEDIGEGRAENEDGREFEYILGVSDDSPEPPPVDSTEDPGSGSPVPGLTGGAAVGDDVVTPAVDAALEHRQDADPNRAPPAQGVVPAPAEPSKGDRQRTRDPWLPELSESDPRAREKMRWWRYRKKAVFRQTLAGTDDRDQLLALGLVTYIEWVLINKLNEAVPHDSGPWSSDRRQQEVRVRERRLCDTEPRRLWSFKGWRGIISRLRGKKPVSLDIYYLREIAKMEREPDDAPFQAVLEALEAWEEHSRPDGGQDVSNDDLS